MTLSGHWRNAPLHVLSWGMTDVSEQSNITLVRSFFTAWGDGRPADLRSAYETFLSEDCRYGERLKDRDAMLRWLFGDQYDARSAAEPDGFFPGGPEDMASIVRVVPDLKRVAANEDLVFIERVDHHYDAEGQDRVAPLVAMMEIRNGKIATWRDYWAYEAKEY